MYRVNYADGEVSQSFRHRDDALAHLKGLTESPHAFIQVWVAGQWS